MSYGTMDLHFFLHRTLQERQLQALEFYPLRFKLKQLSELLGARSHLRGILDTAEDDIFQPMLTHHLDVTLTKKKYNLLHHRLDKSQF